MKFKEYHWLLESINYGTLERNKGKHLQPLTKIGDLYSNSLYEYEKLLYPKYHISGIVLKVHVFYNRKNIKLDFDTYSTILPPYSKTWTKVVKNILWSKLTSLGYQSMMVLPVWKDLMNNPGERATVKILMAKAMIKNSEAIV